MRIPPSSSQQNVSGTNGASANGTPAGTSNGALPAHFEGAVNGPVPNGAQAVAGQPNGVGIDYPGGVAASPASQPERPSSLALAAAQMSMQRAQAVLDSMNM